MTAAVLENLGLLAGAPGGIPRLRQLILELAVRGLLVSQDATNAPASHELEQLARARSNRAAVVTRRPNRAGSNESCWPYSIPFNWQWSKLADIVDVLNGRAYKKEELLNAGIPVLRVGNLFTSNHWYYSDLVLDDDKYCKAGDLIFAWSASFGPFIWSGEKVIYHYHIWKLKPHDEGAVCKQYLNLFLQERTQAIKAAGHGVSMAHMTKEKMEQLPVALPPLPEQHRIVAKVDELMALCDRLEARQQDAEAAHARLVQALLDSLTQARDAEEFQAAWQRVAGQFSHLFTTDTSVESLRRNCVQLGLRGLVCPVQESDGDAGELLNVIRESKARAWQAGEAPKPKVFSPIAPADQPYSLPAGWRWVRLGQLGITSTGSTPPTSHIDAFGGTMPFIGPGQISATGVISVGDKSLSDTGLALSTLAKPKDLLMVCIGGSIGKSAMADRDLAFNQQINSLRVLDACADYVHLVICSPEFLHSVLAAATGSATPIINRSKWEELPVPLPPLAAQHRIVAKVTELLALCDQLKARIAAARAQHAQLAQALMQQALAG